MAKFTPIYESFSSYDVAYFNKQTDWLLKSVMMIDLATEPHLNKKNTTGSLSHAFYQYDKLKLLYRNTHLSNLLIFSLGFVFWICLKC